MNEEKCKMIGSNIRAERSRVGYTQEKVANELGIATKTYIGYEKDATNLRVGSLINIASILGCKIDDFFIQK